tara:strand:- start:4865 stop:5386 length:522 start_codon:yes stop_codon:yes gene_type:complete
MKNTVTVVLNDDGQIIRPSKNPDFGYILLEQVVVEIKDGWIKKNRKTTVVSGETTLLNEQLPYFQKPLLGNIITEESMTPTDLNDPTKDIKMGGDSGVVCMVDNQPIYRTEKFTTDLTKTSTFIKHDNGHEISNKYSSSTEVQTKVSETSLESFLDVKTDDVEVEELVEEIVE